MLMNISMSCIEVVRFKHQSLYPLQGREAPLTGGSRHRQDQQDLQEVGDVGEAGCKARTLKDPCPHLVLILGWGLPHDEDLEVRPFTVTVAFMSQPLRRKMG